MKSVLVISLLLLFVAGCGQGFVIRSPFTTTIKSEQHEKENLLASVDKSAGKGLSTVWALSESNKLIFMLILFAVIAGGIGAVTHLRAAWVICGLNGIAVFGVILLTVLAEAMTKYISVIGIVVVSLMVLGLAYLVLKFFITAKEAFAYGESLKKKVNGDNLKEVNEVAKSSQPKFVRNVIKWFRES